MEKLRILLTIHHHLDPDSGAPGATAALGLAMQALGHSVSHLSFDDLPRALPERAKRLVFPPFLAARAGDRRGVDVVDASEGDAWVWGSIRDRRRRPLLVTRSHGLEHLFAAREIEHARSVGRPLSARYHLYHAGWRLREVTRSLRSADVVFVLNERERTFAVEELGVESTRVYLTANGLPDSFLAAARRTNADGGGSRVAFVGAYREMKGSEYAARALTAAMEERADLAVSFLGTGVPRETVLADFPPRLHERIATVERYERESLPSLLEGHAIVAFPSLSDGFGMGLLEAMACGLAPVASRTEGPERLVANGRNGLLVPCRDADALGSAILSLLADPRLLRRFQTQARSAAEGYRWSAIATSTQAIYREGLERLREPRAESRRRSVRV